MNYLKLIIIIGVLFVAHSATSQDSLKIISIRHSTTTTYSGGSTQSSGVTNMYYQLGNSDMVLLGKKGREKYFNIIKSNNQAVDAYNHYNKLRKISFWGVPVYFAGVGLIAGGCISGAMNPKNPDKSLYYNMLNAYSISGAVLLVAGKIATDIIGKKAINSLVMSAGYYNQSLKKSKLTYLIPKIDLSPAFLAPAKLSGSITLKWRL